MPNKELHLLVAAFATARAEVREMLEKFGAKYAAYMKTTGMFVPWIFQALSP